MAQCVAGLAAGTTHQRLQSGSNFDQRKGFTQIVICAQAQAFNAFRQRVASGQNQYRLLLPVSSPFAQNVPSVYAWQCQVEDYRIIRCAVECFFPLATFGKPVNAETHFTQTCFQAIANQRVIFDQ